MFCRAGYWHYSTTEINDGTEVEAITEAATKMTI